MLNGIWEMEFKNSKENRFSNKKLEFQILFVDVKIYSLNFIFYSENQVQVLKNDTNLQNLINDLKCKLYSLNVKLKSLK